MFTEEQSNVVLDRLEAAATDFLHFALAKGTPPKEAVGLMVASAITGAMRDPEWGVAIAMANLGDDWAKQPSPWIDRVPISFEAQP